MIRRYLSWRSASQWRLRPRRGSVAGGVEPVACQVGAARESRRHETPRDRSLDRARHGCRTVAFFIWAARVSNGADLDSVLVRPIDPDDDHVAWAHVRGACLAHRDDPAGWRRPDRRRTRGDRRAVVQCRAVRSRHGDLRAGGDARCLTTGGPHRNAADGWAGVAGRRTDHRERTG